MKAKNGFTENTDHISSDSQQKPKQKNTLGDLIKRGGIYRDVSGTTPKEVLNSLIGVLPLSSPEASDKLLEAVLEREALMSTGIGGGIAVPHPRNPIANPDSNDPLEDNDEFVVLAFLQNPIDWHSLDGEKVDTLLLIVTASPKQHLKILSEISFFCRQDDFYKLLKERSSMDKILDFIKVTERNWK